MKLKVILFMAGAVILFLQNCSGLFDTRHSVWVKNNVVEIVDPDHDLNGLKVEFGDNELKVDEVLKISLVKEKPELPFEGLNITGNGIGLELEGKQRTFDSPVRVTMPLQRSTKSISKTGFKT